MTTARKPRTHSGKPGRRRLARAELLLHLARSADRWKRELRDEDNGRPFAEWPEDDALKLLTRKYELTPHELAKVCDELGEMLEQRALSSGYDEVPDDPS